MSMASVSNGTGQVDVAIIGAGIIGAAVALELSRRGFRTVNIDKLPAAGFGPTGNSCAIVRTHYSTEQGVAMAHEASAYWRDWASYVGDADENGVAKYVQCGVVLLKSATGQYKKSQTHYEAVGVDWEDWDIDTLTKKVPFLDTHSYFPPKKPSDPGFWDAPTETLEGAIFNPAAGYVTDPQLATHNLQRAAEALGAQFRFRERVTGVEQKHGHVSGVTLAGGETVRAGVVVNIAGPHSFVINELAGVLDDMRIGTRALRHEVHHVPGPEHLDYSGPIISDGDLGIYFRPDHDNHVLVGSEDPISDERIWVEDPDQYDRAITEEQWEAQVYRLAKRVPAVKIPTARKGIVDLYDVADDWIPIYDRSSLPGFYMAVGTSGNQFKNAPVAGLAMAELIERVEGGQDHDHDPVRFSGNHTGVEVDLGFYSRMREVHAASSLSVSG